MSKKAECRLLVLGQALPPELSSSPLVTSTELWPTSKLPQLLKPDFATDCDGLILLHDPPRSDALAALEKLSGSSFSLPIVVLDAQPTVEHATQCLRAGAVDYLSLPTRTEDLAAAVERIRQLGRRAAENELLRRTVERSYSSFEDVIGASPPMRKVFDTIERVAGSNVDVLILGPTGTGKELIARAIHRRSPRANKPFVPVDCGAIPDNLIESELLATSAARSRGPMPGESGYSNLLTAARCFSTSSANSQRRCNRSCCARCKNAASAALAGARKSTSICGSSRRRHAISTP